MCVRLRFFQIVLRSSVEIKRLLPQTLGLSERAKPRQTIIEPGFETSFLLNLSRFLAFIWPCWRSSAQRATSFQESCGARHSCFWATTNGDEIIRTPSLLLVFKCIVRSAFQNLPRMLLLPKRRPNPHELQHQCATINTEAAVRVVFLCCFHKAFLCWC